MPATAAQIVAQTAYAMTTRLLLSAMRDLPSHNRSLVPLSQRCRGLHECCACLIHASYEIGKLLIRGRRIGVANRLVHSRECHVGVPVVDVGSELQGPELVPAGQAFGPGEPALHLH